MVATLRLQAVATCRIEVPVDATRGHQREGRVEDAVAAVDHGAHRQGGLGHSAYLPIKRLINPSVAVGRLVLRLGDEPGPPWRPPMSTIAAHPVEPDTKSTSRRRGVLGVVAIALLAVALAGCMPDDAQTFLDRTNSLRKTNGVRRPRRARHPHREGRGVGAAHGLHGSPGALDAQRRASSSLAWTALGENVGYSSPTSNTLLTIHNTFVNSAAHRRNMVNPIYTHMGVGVAKDSSGRIWVAEVFARI